MAGLTSLLNTARDALSAQSYGLNVAGQNVSNANTPQYVRREAIIQTRALGTQTTGTVEALGLRRASDAYVDRRYFAANSGQNAASQYDGDLAQLEAVFNDLSGTGFGNTLDALFQSFRQLSTQPDSVVARADVLSKLDAFTSRSSEIGDSLANQQFEMVGRAREMADQANARAAEIAQLNQRIVVAKQLGEDASDLIDQRNAKLLGLSGIIDVRTLESKDGSVMVQSGGTTLIEGSTNRNLSISLDKDGKLQVLASRPGGPAADITSGLSGGTLAGLKDAREDVFDISARFDSLVFDVATAINQQHKLGQDLNGTPGTDVFEISSTSTGAARTVRVSASVVDNPSAIAAAATAESIPGGSGNAVLLGKLASVANIFGNRTASEAYGDVVGMVGTKRASATSDATLKQDVFSQAEAARESLGGVSLDEEMVNLQKYQRAYEAATKVLSTVDTLLEELIARVGR